MTPEARLRMLHQHSPQRTWFLRRWRGGYVLSFYHGPIQRYWGQTAAETIHAAYHDWARHAPVTAIQRLLDDTRSTA